MSATPGPAHLQARGSSASVPARACIAPFPCKRRVHWISFDSQEAWARIPPPSLQRLRCEYTDKEPSHCTGEDSAGTADKEAAASHINAAPADQERRPLSDEHSDAHLQVRCLCQLEARTFSHSATGEQFRAHVCFMTFPDECFFTCRMLLVCAPGAFRRTTSTRHFVLDVLCRA